MQRWMLAKHAWLLLFIAACVIYFYGLGHLPLVGPDEPRYAQVAREMFERADAVTPTLAGHTWFEKPALLYWWLMAGYAAFGISEWSARLGSACSGLATVLLVGWLARRVESVAGEGMRSFGIASAACMATSAGLIVFSHGVGFDIIITMSSTLALTCFFVSELEPEGRRRYSLLAGFYAGMGLSLLAKGLIGAVLPVGVVAVYFLLRRKRPRLLELGVWWGPLLTVAVAAVWYAPVIARHGWAFIDEFFVQHHFARYVSNKYHHPQPFYFYIPIMLLLQLPWTAFLVSALSTAPRWKWRDDEPASNLRLFALAWLVVPVAFFSLSGSKLPGYILPALPGAALLAGGHLAKFMRGEGGTKAMRATGALLLTLALGGLVFAARTEQVPLACALANALPVAIAAALALLWPRLRRLCAGLIVGVAPLVVVLIVSCAAPQVARRESVRDLLKLADARGYSSSPVFHLHTVERTAEFYAPGRLAYDTEGEPIKFEGADEVVDAARQSGREVLVFVPVEHAGQLTGHAAIETKVIGDNGSVALVAARSKQ